MASPFSGVISFICLFLWTINSLPVYGQSDSTSTDIDFQKRDPHAALRRGFIPGWGQLYNREYYKVPLVYAGLAAFAGSALLVNRRYLLYRHAYLFTARVHQDGSPIFPEYESDYSRLLRVIDLIPESNLMSEEIKARRIRLEPQIRSQRDALRRNRDLLYLGIIAWYSFTILDAYVSAHLSEFDVNESLAVRITGGPERLGLALTW